MPKEMGMSKEMSMNGRGGHLYMQTNEVKNAIIHYHRSANGTLTEVERVVTGGAGSGTFKPISGQESAPYVRQSVSPQHCGMGLRKFFYFRPTACSFIALSLERHAETSARPPFDIESRSCRLNGALPPAKDAFRHWRCACNVQKRK
jgi:hypothetical protein